MDRHPSEQPENVQVIIEDVLVHKTRSKTPGKKLFTPKAKSKGGNGKFHLGHTTKANKGTKPNVEAEKTEVLIKNLTNYFQKDRTTPGNTDKTHEKKVDPENSDESEMKFDLIRMKNEEVRMDIQEWAVEIEDCKHQDGVSGRPEASGKLILKVQRNVKTTTTKSRDGRERTRKVFCEVVSCSDVKKGTESTPEDVPVITMRRLHTEKFVTVDGRRLKSTIKRSENFILGGGDQSEKLTNDESNLVPENSHTKQDGKVPRIQEPTVEIVTIEVHQDVIQFKDTPTRSTRSDEVQETNIGQKILGTPSRQAKIQGSLNQGSEVVTLHLCDCVVKTVK